MVPHVRSAVPVLRPRTAYSLREQLLLSLLVEGPADQEHLGNAVDKGRSAVLEALGALVDSRDVTRQPRPGGGRGRPKVDFNAAPDRAAFIGISVEAPERGPCKMHATLTDRSPHHALRHHDVVLEKKRPTPTALVNAIGALVADMEAVSSDGKVSAVGVCLGGHIDDSGDVVRSPNLKWEKRVHLASLVEARVGRPAIVINDVDALALHRATIATTYGRTFAEVLVEDGVGAALVIDGALYTGANGGACELGHIIVNPNGRKCPCGLRGCLQTVASCRAIRLAGRAADLGNSAEDVVAIADSSPHDARFDVAQRILDDSADALGRAVGALSSVLDPGLVVLSSTALSGSTRFKQRFESVLRASTFPSLLPELMWVATDHTEAARGAAWAALLSSPLRR